MSHRYPPRRRGQPRLDDEFVDYDPYQAYQQPYQQPYEQPYGAYDPYEQYVPRNSAPPEPRSPPKSSPPRRRKSEKHRRAPSPIYYSDEPSNSSRRHGKRAPRHEEDRRGRSAGPDRQGRGPSPPPFVTEPEPSRRHHRSSRAERDARRKSEPRFMDPYEQDFYPREPPPRHYPSEPRERSARDRDRDGDMDRDLDRNRSHRSRSVREPPSEHRSRGRSSRHPGMEDGNEYMTTSRRHPDMDDGNDYIPTSRRHPGMEDDNVYATPSRRRPRSQTRGRQDRRAPSGPSPTRGRPPPTSRGREPTNTKRRSSMPATTKNGIPWWQNPLVQAGARTALTAGAQAAMKSRNDQGDWLGAKGAKIATAALGAALVDGFIGQKHPNSTRHSIAKQGVDLASSKAAVGADRAARHHH